MPGVRRTLVRAWAVPATQEVLLPDVRTAGDATPTLPAPQARPGVAGVQERVRAPLAGPRGRSRQAHTGWTAVFVIFCVAYLLACCGLVGLIAVDLAR